MKTPQRKFVVELKSGRRQPKATAASIWGDTDFKALVREVEDDASHLFNSNAVASMPGEGGDMPPDPMTSGSASEHAGDAEIAPATIPSADGATVEVQKQHEADFPTAGALAQVQESQSASAAQTTSTGSSRTRAKGAPARAIEHISRGVHEDKGAQSRTARDTISSDEVAGLDAENKRLKGLLAKQLHEQNLHLRKILNRFDDLTPMPNVCDPV
jgi:hypothetical protein